MATPASFRHSPCRKTNWCAFTLTRIWSFRALKGVVKLQPIRHWLSQRVTAHVFICYLAYLLLALLKYRLKPTGISPEEALDELSTMYKVYLQDSKQVHRLSRVVTLTRRQETILKAINPALLKAQN